MRRQKGVGFEKVEQQVSDFFPARCRGMGAIIGKVFPFLDEAIGFSGSCPVGPEVRPPKQ